MQHVNLEHVNVTVSDPERTAQMLCEIFDWHIRWHGGAINDGITYHVGSDTSYVAIYSNKSAQHNTPRGYDSVGSLNHIAVVVEDIDRMEKRVMDAGLKPHSHADYEPGKRFYFEDHDGIEYEVVSYNA